MPNKYTLFLFSIFVCFSKSLIGQSKFSPDTKSGYYFFPNNEDRYGLSTPHASNTLSFDTMSFSDGDIKKISVKSLKKRRSGKVDFVIKKGSLKIISELRFIRESDRSAIKYSVINDSLLNLKLPASEEDYMVYCFYKDQILNALKVKVFDELSEKVILVPLVSNLINKDSLRVGLNKIFGQACMKIDLQIKPFFLFETLKDIDRLKNPVSSDQYTDQMHQIRDAYFKRFPNADKRAFYVFLTPSFVNGQRNGFCVQSKALSFIPFDTTAIFVKNCATVLAQSIGYLRMKKDGTWNLMSPGEGIWLDHEQWESIRHNSHTFSKYDNYEDIQTNNGSVAYYFWREDLEGNIILESEGLLSSVKRPFKKNNVSYHLDINEFMFSPKMVLWGRKFCLWHLLALIFIFPVLAYVRVKVLKGIYRKLRKPSFWRILSAWLVLALTIVFNFIAFQLIDIGFKRFEVSNGLLRDLGKRNTVQAINALLHNQPFEYQPETRLRSEILRRVEGKWYIKVCAQVLYFDCLMDENQKIVSARFVKDSDSLKLEEPQVNMKVRSHYMVVNYRNQKNELLFQKLYNHLGSELEDKLFTKNPINRILLFVNGYRPTSMGHSFEENFEDLRKNGLEYPNSYNIIYDFDRYDYWRPWNAIDSMFSDRINPNKTYYADGHFSVSTSNHGSLLNFSALAAVYPKRCKNRKHHTCYQTVVTSSGWFGSKNRKTKELLRLSPNYEGFKIRYTNGMIAGRSLLQELNEIPNRTENDTIYIVAHSMGYAYALGMIKELRGRIRFGGLYIIAPENAFCGRIIREEWKEVWQYGSNFNPEKEDAPCLQDGVAPQTGVRGLTKAYRCYIPSNLYNSKGFFDSHFVGYYSWIFDIPQGSKGAIRQR